MYRSFDIQYDGKCTFFFSCLQKIRNTKKKSLETYSKKEHVYSFAIIRLKLNLKINIIKFL